MEEIQGQVIIAMKGHPCTGKSTCAGWLARNPDWPLIVQDDVYSCLLELQQSSPAYNITAEGIDDMSFESVCQMADTLIQVGLNVVIDSPLTRQAQLDRLLQLSASSGARLLIVECRPKDVYEWQFRLEKRGPVKGSISYRYEPSTWEDLPRLLELVDGSLDYDVGQVSKLVVDTTSDFADFDLFFCVNEILTTSESFSHVELVGWMADLIKRRDQRRIEKEEKDTKRRPHWHHLTFANEQSGDTVTCAKCEALISGPIYNCDLCEFSLHKSCGETPYNVVILPQDHPAYLGTNAIQYSFTKKQSCNLCTAENKDFSYECAGCLFQTHLTCDLLPSVIHHDGHEHPLYLRMTPVSDGIKFHCHACGDDGLHIGYFCDDCHFKCHAKCALSASTIKNKYHMHFLTRSYSHQHDGSDEIYCNACETKRNPKHWIYFCKCKECEFACHLNCTTFME